jgi:hypothetical protein
MRLALRSTSGAVRIEASVAESIQHALRENAARRIAGAKKERVVALPSHAWAVVASRVGRNVMPGDLLRIPDCARFAASLMVRNIDEIP